MLSKLHLITQQLEPLFAVSTLDPEAMELCKQAVDAYLRENIFFESSDFVETMDTLYALNDNKTYSILKVGCDADEIFFLMPAKQGLRYTAIHSASHYMKSSGKYPGASFGTEIKKLHSLTEAIVVEVTKTLTYMKRVATGIKEIVEVDYPPVETLKRFYECGRKIQYESIDDAMAALWDYNDAYLCSHCGKYHQGKTPTTEIDAAIRLQRFQRVWRYSHHLGEFRHKARVE